MLVRRAYGAKPSSSSSCDRLSLSREKSRPTVTHLHHCGNRYCVHPERRRGSSRVRREMGDIDEHRRGHWRQLACVGRQKISFMFAIRDAINVRPSRVGSQVFQLLDKDDVFQKGGIAASIHFRIARRARFRIHVRMAAEICASPSSRCRSWRAHQLARLARARESRTTAVSARRLAGNPHSRDVDSLS